MGSENVRYSVGEAGKMFSFTGTQVPDGTTALIEEKDDILTDAGKDYCKCRGFNPHIESIRVLYARQTSDVANEAVAASVRNQEIRLDRDARTKAMSERLRLDWAEQDKAHLAAQKKR